MRLAVFSDAHSNCTALDTCLRYAEHVGVDGYVFLGDLLTDNPLPQRTMELLRAAREKRASWFVRGNREERLLSYRRGGGEKWEIGSATGSFLYTYERLSEEDFRFLSAMPATSKIELPGCPAICACHAAPKANAVLLYPGTEALENVLRGIEENTLLSGHSHLQFRYESAGKQIINPGSVGSHVYSGKAQFALVSCLSGRWSARLMNVDYDVDAEIRLFEEDGLLEMGGAWARAVRKSLRTSGPWCIELLETAKKIAQACDEALSEEHWEEAAARLGI